MAGEQKEGLSDGQIMLLLVMGVILAAAVFYALKPQMLQMWGRVAVWHTQVLSGVDDNAIGNAFYKLIHTDADKLERLGRGIAQSDVVKFSGKQVWEVSEYIGFTLRWFLAPLMLLLAWDVARYRIRYRQYFANGAALFGYVQKNFGKHLGRAQNALKADLYTGSHAVAKTPWRWATENNCIKPDESLDEAKAIDALRKQLGTSFTTWDALLNGKNGWIAKEILSFLKSRSDRNGVISFATRGHRYESTVLVALLLATRRFGVVSCMVFAGLRNTNRALWYALESAGRRVAFIEGAGIMAQYEYEMALIGIGEGKHAPQEGRVEAAIAGLKEALEIEVKEATVDAPSENSVWDSYDPTKN